MPEVYDYTRLAPGEAFDRAVVTVTFLRLDKFTTSTPPVPPDGAILKVETPDVTGYRKLYNEVGAPWLWWLRRVMPDELLAQHLASRTVSIRSLWSGGHLAGFYELDSSVWPDVNLNYFGLLPGAIGQGLGRYMLAAAIYDVFGRQASQARATGLRGMTVNTCTADHPRALPNYLAAGFVETRRVQEVWDIPTRLGLKVAEHLRG